jgi:rod shape-determining protein MreD
MNTIEYNKIIIFFIGILLIILPISPISNQPVFIEKPDFLICLMFGWIILDPKYSSISVIILLSFFADIVWYRPLGLWPLLILLGFFIIKFILTKISVDSFFIKMIYFTLFLLTIDTFIFITSLIGLTEKLDFNIWINRFIFSILSFPLIVYLLQIFLFKDKKKKNQNFYNGNKFF